MCIRLHRTTRTHKSMKLFLWMKFNIFMHLILLVIHFPFANVQCYWCLILFLLNPIAHVRTTAMEMEMGIALNNVTPYLAHVSFLSIIYVFNIIIWHVECAISKSTNVDTLNWQRCFTLSHNVQQPYLSEASA